MKKKTILIAEDDESLRESLKEVIHLEMRDTVKAVTVANGEEALRFMNEVRRSIDLIILDLMMPVMNGVDFLHKIIKEDRTFLHKIPVVILSASTLAEKVASDLGLSCLKKPFSIEELTKLIEEKLHA